MLFYVNSAVTAGYRSWTVTGGQHGLRQKGRLKAPHKASFLLFEWDSAQTENTAHFQLIRVPTGSHPEPG